MPALNLIATQELGYRFVPRQERGPSTIEERLQQIRDNKAAREEESKPKKKRASLDDAIDLLEGLL